MTETTKNYICVTRAGQESFINRECEALKSRPQCTELASGVVELSGLEPRYLSTAPLFFAQQLLPEPVKHNAPSVKKWALCIFEQLAQHFDGTSQPWSLHVFEAASVETGKQYSRPRLIEQETLALLKEKRRSLLKDLLPVTSPSATLVQVLLLSPECGFISFATPEDFLLAAPALSFFFAGYVPIDDDQAPPSRAFKKLKEAQAVLGLSLQSGLRCADLGASPGGWTHVLAKAGCLVWAVDRSPLDPRLMKDRRVTFATGDAFKWLPEKPLDLMVCDVIAAPDRTLSLMERWITQKLCRSFCVTVKFKGAPDFAVLRDLKEFLADSCQRFVGKQLTCNKNEVTIVGWLKT